MILTAVHHILTNHCFGARPSKGGGVPGRFRRSVATRLLCRGVHRPVQALEVDIRDWIDTWNDKPRPYMWTRTADKILDNLAAYCQRVNQLTHDSGHYDIRSTPRMFLPFLRSW